MAERRKSGITNREADILLRDIYHAHVEINENTLGSQPLGWVSWMSQRFYHDDPTTNPISQEMVDMLNETYENRREMMEPYHHFEDDEDREAEREEDSWTFFECVNYCLGKDVFCDYVQAKAEGITEGLDEYDSEISYAEFWAGYKKPRPHKINEEILQEVGYRKESVRRS